MIPFQLFYDITSVKIKYEEGFANVLGRIFTKPEVMWTKADKALVIPTEYSLCIGFSLQTGTLVLLQCFWNYLANSVAEVSFMSSKEFMFYIFWTCSSFVLFPLLQYNFSREIYEPTYKEIIPEMVYGIELFIVGLLGVISHFRFKKLLSNSRDTDNGRSIAHKIRYFQEINKILSTVLFGHGGLLTTLSIDGLTTRKYLNIHKFTADFFICNINMCAVITWLCMILIFHPKHSTTPEAASNNNSENEIYANGNESKQFNNNSGISSTNTYSHAPTLVAGHSQAPSEYMYKGVHPLSKSGTLNSSHADSAFHFGPLPTPPHNDVNMSFRNKNNSIASTAPSMTTLVSPQNNHNSDKNCGYQFNSTRSHKATSISSNCGGITNDSSNNNEYFPINIHDERTLPSSYINEISYQQQLQQQSKLNSSNLINTNKAMMNANAASYQPNSYYVQQEEKELADPKNNYRKTLHNSPMSPLNMSSAFYQHQHQQQHFFPPHNSAMKALDDPFGSVVEEEEDDEYVPPPLSPARKNRDIVSQQHHLLHQQPQLPTTTATTAATATNDNLTASHYQQQQQQQQQQHQQQKQLEARRYTHSMNIITGEEDMRREFGINNQHQPVTLKDESSTKQQINNNSEEKNFISPSLSNNKHLHQQNQQMTEEPDTAVTTAMNNTNNTAAISHPQGVVGLLNQSTSSLLLPLPFEQNYQNKSHNSQQQSQQYGFMDENIAMTSSTTAIKPSYNYV
ncbi:hypothetical protein BDF20DRAFT_835043 [Mycotypha africana]|uniref:uncharacterized protein n=1 Tax=Mycotypha africana TaxID=64632 RepID=UPI0022FFF7EF|nr:uncharacterized protein BDF20DRAFT_835043 [Mycotypha africana]KAI8982421.1 hypothetical protein BDF20DRAFT_835043 [Mycotypha africana]